MTDDNTERAPMMIRRHVVVQLTDGVYWLMWRSGEVETATSPEAAVLTVRTNDAALNKLYDAVVVTSIEWEGVPEGFVPPPGS